jgi:hypothetical protein
MARKVMLPPHSDDSEVSMVVPVPTPSPAHASARRARTGHDPARRGRLGGSLPSLAVDDIAMNRWDSDAPTPTSVPDLRASAE